MINAIPQGSTIYGVLVGEFSEDEHRVVNPVVGVKHFNAQNPALVLVAEDTANNFIWSADVYGNLSSNNWEPTEDFNVTLMTALNARVTGVTFTPGSSVILDNPDMVFSI